MDQRRLDSRSLEQELQEADADIVAGRFATHAQVSAWLDRWGDPGGSGPAPRPWLDLEGGAKVGKP